MVDLGLAAVELDDQQRLDVERIAGMDEVLGRVIAGRSIISMPPGMMPAAMTSATQSPAPSTVGKPISTARAAGGLRQDAHGHLGDDAEQALGADHHAEQIVALGIEMLAAEAHDLAVDQHHLDAEHVVGGEAVFQAMHAAGILGDVAADGAGDLARRIGRVVEAERPARRW